jgi:acetate kinase
VRAQICEGLEFLGLDVDAALNRENAGTISASGSRVRVRTIKANEEAMIARHTRQAIRASQRV